MTPKEFDFLCHLGVLDVPIFTATPGNGNEFDRPGGWSRLDPAGNRDRIRARRSGSAVAGVMGGRVAVIDIDTRNGGDPGNVKQLLDALHVTVYADVRTPGGGRHFYVAGHSDLPTVHASSGRDGFTGYPGVEVISFGANVYLPGTLRPRYNGHGYVILANNLEALADGGAPHAGETFAGWVADNRAHNGEPFTPSPRWNGAPPDKRQAAYLAAVLTNLCAELAAMGPNSGRNVALYTAGLKCGNYVAGAGMDEIRVIEALTDAADTCGLTGEDTPSSVLATIRSGLLNGRSRPRAVPDPPHVPPPGVGLTIGPLGSQGSAEAVQSDLAGVRQRFPRLDLASLLSAQRPPREWVVDGLIPSGASIALIAPAGTGKSLLLLGCMIGVARGDRTFAGLSIPKGRRVILVDMENTEDDLADRLAALGITAANVAALDQLVILHLPPLAPLDTAVGGADFAALLDAYHVVAGDVVVLDSLQRVINGPENDSDTMRAFYRCTAVELKRRGLTVVRTDNTGHDVAKRARGTSGKRDDVDVELILTREADHSDRLRIKPGKSRLPDIASVLIDRDIDDDGQLTFTTLGDPFRALVGDAHTILDRLNVPVETGERKAAEIIKAHRLTVVRKALRTAIKERKNSLLAAPNSHGAPSRAEVEPERAEHSGRTDGAPVEIGESEHENRAEHPRRTPCANEAVAHAATAPPLPLFRERRARSREGLVDQPSPCAATRPTVVGG
jgi:AAA domain